MLTFRQDPANATGDRQVSVGTVWTVGGLAPFSAGVPDGRGGLLGSGTNAPLYTTSFTAAKPKAKEDMELHESRIAQALDIDRVGRILEFRGRPPSRPSQSNRDQSPNPKFEQKTTWQGTEWVLGGPYRSMYSCYVFTPPLTRNIIICHFPHHYRTTERELEDISLNANTQPDSY